MFRLYTLLCGPILRRTEPNRVCIWLATSIQPESIDVVLYPLQRPTGGADWGSDEIILPSTTYNVHQLGGRLFAILLEVRPFGEGERFKTDVPYGYDLHFKFRDQDKVILTADDFKSGDGSAKKEFSFTEVYNRDRLYTYPRLPYPVFIVPNSDAPNARILYGSCRKLHGPGSDAFNAADKLVEVEWAAHTADANHPAPDYCHFMLGDQIYADDLIEEVFAAVRGLADALMGYDETIPEFDGIQEIGTKDLSDFLKGYYKAAAGFEIRDLNTTAKLTYLDAPWPNFRLLNIVKFLDSYFSGKTDVSFVRTALESPDPDIVKTLSLAYNRLGLPLVDLNEILPREYMRRNLPVGIRNVKTIFYWVRKDFVRRNATISTQDHGHVLSFGEFAALYLLAWSQFKFLEEGSPEWIRLMHLGYKYGSPYYDDFKHNLETIIEGNRRTIRLLANVPSYMIFDDHEITDEWNYDETWRNAVERRSVTGRRMIANGLAAYWAFQGWGNVPEAFPSTLIDTIKAYLLAPLRQDTQEPRAKPFEDSILKFDDWAFLAPTNPVTVFMDNRTMRGPVEEMDYYTQLNKDKKYRAARLMTDASYKKVMALLQASRYKPRSTIIFCAPTPIIGSKMFEEGQLDMIDQTFNTDKVLAGFFPRPTGRWDNDFESWSANPRSRYDFFYFLDTVVQPSNVVILSGDVHYGFHATAEICSAVTGRCYFVEQLTSSAFKNSTLEKISKLDLLSYLSIGGTHEEKYKKIDDIYPVPGAGTASGYEVPGYYLKAHLVRYSTELVDKDTWLIFWNNIGLVEIRSGKSSASFTSSFLWSPYSLAPLTISRQISPPPRW